MRPILVLLLLLGACATPAPIAEAEVQAVLDEQRAAWNVGDLDGFMATYWKSPHLSFVGSSGVTRGWEETRARYRRSCPDAAARGELSFELLEVRPLGDGSTALVIGRWELRRDEPARGLFTLVVERRREGLRIVHDHSSASSGD